MKSGSKTRNVQSPRPFSLYLSTYSPKLGRSNNRSRSKSPTPKSSSVHGMHSKNSQTRKSYDSICHGCIPQSDFNHNLDVSLKSPSYSRIENTSEEEPFKNGWRLRRSAIMPVGPSTVTWKFPKHTNVVRLPSIVYGLTMNKQGDMFVTMDLPKQGGIVQCYDKTGNQTSTFNLRPSMKLSKKFEPFQICEMPDGNLVVACSNCVTVWTKEGKLIAEHGKNMFKFCKNVAVRSTGEIIITDSDDSGMLKSISPNGQFITKIDTDISCPAGVAVDSEDNIIVTDWKHTVRVYDRDNELIRTFGAKGSRDNELDMPYGMCVDCDDNIVLADMWNHRISVYTREGKFVNHIATQASNGIHRPQYVALMVDPGSGEYKLAVSEFWNNAVRIMAY